MKKGDAVDRGPVPGVRRRSERSRLGPGGTSIRRAKGPGPRNPSPDVRIVQQTQLQQRKPDSPESEPFGAIRTPSATRPRPPDPRDDPAMRGDDCYLASRGPRCGEAFVGACEPPGSS